MRPLVLLAILLLPCSVGCNDDLVAERDMIGGDLWGPDGGPPVDLGVDASMAPGAALLKVCALVTSCDLWPHERSGPSCVAIFKQGLQSFERTFYGPQSQFQAYLDCAVGAADCDGLLRCVSGGRGDAY